MNTRTIKVSLGDTKYDKFPKDLVLSRDELVTKLTTFPEKVTKKGDGGYLVSGHFNNKNRVTANLQQKTLISLDVDFYDKDLKSLEKDVEHALYPHGYIAYSTSSHCSERPRMRIVAILSREVGVETFRDVARNFIQTLGEFVQYIELAVSCMPNNPMYLPIKTSDDYVGCAWVKDGQDIDVDDFKPEGNFGNKRRKLMSQIGRLQIGTHAVKTFLKKMSAQECDYNQWLKVGMGLHHQFEGEISGHRIWLDWSLVDTRYESKHIKEQCEEKWTSFCNDSGREVTFRGVINMINEHCIQQPIEQTKKDKRRNVGPVQCASWVQVTGKHLKPVNSIENFKVLLEHYDINVRYNIISKCEDIYFNGKKSKDLNTAETEIKSLAIVNNLPHQLVSEFIAAIAAKHRWNPWNEWVKSKPWDKQDRLGAFCNTVTVKEGYDEIRDTYIKAWLLQLMHMTCLNDGNKLKMGRNVLVFQGDQQSGKTTWFNHLVPDDKSSFIQSGVTLNVADHMSVLSCVKNVMVELGELDSTFRKSDMENLKNFISTTRDSINMKYAKHHIEPRRRTVFFASVNDSKFLQDKTGNSRFLVLPIVKCDAYHGIDHQQLYAQMLELAQLDSDYELNEKYSKIRADCNKEFETISVIEEKFMEVYDVDNPSEVYCTLTTATKVLENLGFQVSNMKHYQNETAKLLDGMGFKRSKSHNKRGWLLPPLTCQNDVF